MSSKSKPRASAASNKRAAPSVARERFVNIEDLLAQRGEITIGAIASVACAATAADSDQCLAMLQRREGEGLLELLARLDRAIARARDEDEFIDGINPR
jgi:hypothetical protein